MDGKWRRVGMTAVPASNDGRAALMSVPDGGTFYADVSRKRRERSLRQHNLFWALCEIVADNDQTYDTKEKAKIGLLMATGFVDMFYDRDGNLHIVPRSISFQKMPAEDFSRFFQDAVRVICKWLGSAPQEVIEHINSMLDPMLSPPTVPNHTREQVPA